MTDTDWADAAAMLRALLTDDQATGRRLADEVEGRSAADTFALVVAVAFIIVVRRYFRDGYSSTSVIQLVADVRASSADVAEEIDPVGAENLIRTALGEASNPAAEPDATTKGNTQVATLMTLVGHQQLSDEELHGFIADVLAEARKAR